MSYMPGINLLQENKMLVNVWISFLKLYLVTLSKNCNFQTVSSNQNRDDHIRDSLISGSKSHNIRQCLLENKTLTLEETYEKAKTLEDAEKLSESYVSRPSQVSTASKDFNVSHEEDTLDNMEKNINSAQKTQKCYFCNQNRHPRSKCPARESVCGNCKKIGHWARVCRSAKVEEPSQGSQKLVSASILASVPSYPDKLVKSFLITYLNDYKTETLVDSGSSDSFIDFSFAKALKLHIYPLQESITLASKTASAPTIGYVLVNLKYCDNEFPQTKLTVIKNLCSSLLLGLDHLAKHSEVVLKLGGPQPTLKICNLTTMARLCVKL